MSRNRRGPKAIRSMLLQQPRSAVGQQNLPAMPGGHHPRRTVQHRTEVIRPPAARPRRSPAPSAPATPAPAARPPPHPPQHLGDANAAHTPSPVCLNMKPPCASISPRNTSSWAASAARMPSASASHRRVEPSTSVNRNVTTPEGAAARSADTPAESHNRPRLPRTSADPARSPDTRVLRRTSASRRSRLFRDDVQFCSGLVDLVVGVGHHLVGRRLALAGGLSNDTFPSPGPRSVSRP